MGQRSVIFCDRCRAEHGGLTSNRRPIMVRPVRLIVPGAIPDQDAMVSRRMDLCEDCLGSMTLRQFLEKAKEER